MIGIDAPPKTRSNVWTRDWRSADDENEHVYRAICWDEKLRASFDKEIRAVLDAGGDRDAAVARIESLVPAVVRTENGAIARGERDVPEDCFGCFDHYERPVRIRRADAGKIADSYVEFYEMEHGVRIQRLKAAEKTSSSNRKSRTARKGARTNSTDAGRGAPSKRSARIRNRDVREKQQRKGRRQGGQHEHGG